MIEIKKKSDCCGCTACANACPKSCIEMIEDSEGFLYPVVHEDKCIKCNACEKVCPIINHVERKENRGQTAAIVQNKNKDVYGDGYKVVKRPGKNNLSIENTIWPAKGIHTVSAY